VPDDGFDFHKAPRREAKQFEPPPWEKEAFEDLERKRAQERAAEQPAVEPDAVAETGQAAAGAGEDEQGLEVQPATAEAEATGEPSSDEETDSQLDEAKVVEMLADLSAEDPPGNRTLWRVAVASAIVLGAIGAVLIMWAMAAIVGARRTGAVGWAGGLVLLFFGAGFVAGAWWLTVRTLRQRGVL